MEDYNFSCKFNAKTTLIPLFLIFVCFPKLLYCIYFSFDEEGKDIKTGVENSKIKLSWRTHMGIL